MRYPYYALAFIASVKAIYSGDIVAYWATQCSLLANGTIPGSADLDDPPNGWLQAITFGAVYNAAKEASASSNDTAFHQLAVSHAAHDTLIWTFHGTTLYRAIDDAFRAVLPSINLNMTSPEGRAATAIGRSAAKLAVIERASDGLNYFTDYTPLSTTPGNWQPVPGGEVVPDDISAQFVKMFGGLDAGDFVSGPPPNATDLGYEKYVLYTRDEGAKYSSVRTEYDTESAYYWKESGPHHWNRFASELIGDSLANDVLKSARFFAILNYAMANTNIAAWHTAFTHNYWRPITAIRRPDIWLANGRNISDPSWVPLLDTPNEQEYPSNHASFAGAATTVLRAFNGGDEVDIMHSSNVTTDNVGVVTRRVTNLKGAAQEAAMSRIYAGMHFKYSVEEGLRVGKVVAEATMNAFDEEEKLLRMSGTTAAQEILGS